MNTFTAALNVGSPLVDASALASELPTFGINDSRASNVFR